MALEMCVLASGSGGNATLLRAGTFCALIDAGIGPRTADKRMIGTGIGIQDIRAICLTHMDADHFSPRWLEPICQNQISVYCPQNHAREIRRVARREKLLKPLTRHLKIFGNELFELNTGLTCRSICLPHDKQGSQGFLIQFQNARIGFATDLGRVPVELIDLFAGADIIAMESNYDPDMQLASRRSQRIKDRIMGGHGHLSNQEAFEAVQDMFDLTAQRHGPDRRPRHVVLLHRSRQCNSPARIREAFGQDHRIHEVLTLAHQDQRTEWLSSGPRQPLPGEQLAMFSPVAYPD